MYNKKTYVFPYNILYICIYLYIHVYLLKKMLNSHHCLQVEMRNMLERLDAVDDEVNVTVYLKD